MTPSVPAAEAAYRAVKQQILSGSYAGGRMLSEGEVAAGLGVSRTPAREAFLRLQAEGWMQLYPKRGALVLSPDATERDDLLDARTLLENHAIQHIVDDPETTRDLARRLREITAEQREAAAADDFGAFVAADVRFHAEIMKSGGNAVLTHFAATLRDRQQRLVAHSLGNEPTRRGAVVADHDALARAIADGDAPKFADLLDAHLRRSHR